MTVLATIARRDVLACGCVLAIGERHTCGLGAVVRLPRSICPHDRQDGAMRCCARCGLTDQELANRTVLLAEPRAKPFLARLDAVPTWRRGMHVALTEHTITDMRATLLDARMPVTWLTRMLMARTQ
jgi:hypothetical protein